MRSSAYQPLPLQAYQSHLMKLHITSPPSLGWTSAHMPHSKALIEHLRNADRQEDEDNQIISWSARS